MRLADPRYELLLKALAAEPDPHTTVSQPERAREIHIADSLSGLDVDDLARARRIADVGAGAGFPGLVLAIALPHAKVDLIESAGRKTAVIDRLIQAAKVENARSVTARAEEWAATAPELGGGREAYDAVTARAFAAPRWGAGGLDGDRRRHGEAAGKRGGLQGGNVARGGAPRRTVRRRP